MSGGNPWDWMAGPFPTPGGYQERGGFVPAAGNQAPAPLGPQAGVGSPAGIEGGAAYGPVGGFMTGGGIGPGSGYMPGVGFGPGVGQHGPFVFVAAGSNQAPGPFASTGGYHSPSKTAGAFASTGGFHSPSKAAIDFFSQEGTSGAPGGARLAPGSPPGLSRLALDGDAVDARRLSLQPFDDVPAAQQPPRSARAAGLGATFGGKGGRRVARGGGGDGSERPLPPGARDYDGAAGGEGPSRRRRNAKGKGPTTAPPEPESRITRSRGMAARDVPAAGADAHGSDEDEDEADDHVSEGSSTAENDGDFHEGGSIDEDDGCSSLLANIRDPVRRELATLLVADLQGIRRIMEMASVLAQHEQLYLHRGPYREAPVMSGLDQVNLHAADWDGCYEMFRMRPPVFELLHQVLVDSHGLHSTKKMSSREALGLTLWMLGGPQSVRTVKRMFCRSSGTVSTKFNEVIGCLSDLAKDNVCPKDPTYSTVHPVVANHRYGKCFRNAIGCIDGTHVRVCVPGQEVGKYINRKSDKSQNVLGIVDFDRRFTFVAAGIPGSAHDARVLKEAQQKYGDNFPHPPAGKYYLCDAGYANKTGYLAPYRGVKYHQEEWRTGRRPSTKKEVFNQAHSSLRSAVECTFGIWKEKWRILKGIPSYPEVTQTHIILACAALHNFIIDNGEEDPETEEVNIEEEDEEVAGHASEEEDGNMNTLREEIANECYSLGYHNRRE